MTLALAPALLPELLEVTKVSQIVNAGLDKVRMRKPVPVGSKLRLGASVKSVREMGGGAMRLALDARFEVEDTKRPVCTGEFVYVYYP